MNPAAPTCSMSRDATKWCEGGATARAGLSRSRRRIRPPLKTEFRLDVADKLARITFYSLLDSEQHVSRCNCRSNPAAEFLTTEGHEDDSAIRAGSNPASHL
jgi:hypothetical protein